MWFIVVVTGVNRGAERGVKGAGPGLGQAEAMPRRMALELRWQRTPVHPSSRSLRPVGTFTFQGPVRAYLMLHMLGPAQPLPALFPTPPERYFSFLSCGQENSEDRDTEK